ncbi:class I SAM-dependent methyltransferase [Hymenobacter sp. BT770]|uniref:class I SAM-dependent methyltransferase n=1 Tax=Hymenobacter sp. BT770 TaxID=2886942 RepID=UPI001D0F9B28|nr:class I SAM-dependent methyltransferase [Hymenobacter sp. BT770]MCC3155120.1 class I SAM-dependent methyltransferase [Hymenobacter sp. BT770]MDO3417063.1 class I SAM-dependent methyltransferase [Hymenobacter sp. BT770]
MNIQSAYNAWANTYDTVVNKTRDLEATAIRQLLADIPFSEVIEIGCGTGKNTKWLAAQAAHVTAVDFSVEMLEKARVKNANANVHFQQADITQAWAFVNNSSVDLITCSLILEHIQNLDFVFEQARAALKTGGFFYIGELHPFKQYQGSKARFDNGAGVFELECYTHHVSEFTALAREHGFRCEQLQEWFDDNDRAGIPRILAILFRKSQSEHFHTSR